MKRINNKCDLVVVGGGHAGIEAALVAHKLGIDVVLVSMDIKAIGRMSCNPAIGGLAKGQMVRELMCWVVLWDFLLTKQRFKAKL